MAIAGWRLFSFLTGSLSPGGVRSCAYLLLAMLGRPFGRVSFRGTFCITFSLGGFECPYSTVQHIAWRSTS
jgi:hypothetical protein